MKGKGSKNTAQSKSVRVTMDEKWGRANKIANAPMPARNQEENLGEKKRIPVRANQNATLYQGSVGEDRLKQRGQFKKTVLDAREKKYCL